MLGRDSWPRWVVRFSDIERYEQMSNVALCWWMYGNNIHPVPEHYKYDWWIFWEGAPVDGEMLIFNLAQITSSGAHSDYSTGIVMSILTT